MHQQLDIERYKIIAHKFNLMGCFVQKKYEYIFYFLEEQTKYDWTVENEFIKKKVIRHSLFNPDKSWLSNPFEFGLEDIFFGKTGDHCFFVDGEYRVGNQVDDYFLEGKTLSDDLRLGGIRRLVVINNRTYLVAGGYRSIVKHLGGDFWERLSGIQPTTKKEFKFILKQDYGFDDLAGFSENDMFAVGGKGEVFHYDGKAFSQLAFPSNMFLKTVCCGEDGWVYIGGQNGTVFKGRDQQWKALNVGSYSLEFRDMVWFKDRVYATSDYGFWEIVNDKVTPVDVPEDIKVCSGHLSVGDGVMLLAGSNGIAVFDGDKWEVIADLIMLKRQAEIGR